MSFRIWAIFYTLAVVATALASFGVPGVIAAALVLLFWWNRCYSRQPLSLVALLVSAVIVLSLVVLLWPGAQSISRESARRAACLNQLRQLGCALFQYADDHGTLPPAYVADGDGRRLASWRAAILPQLDYGDFGERFDIRQAWDSSANIDASSSLVESFRCPSDKNAWSQPITSYFALVGSRTAWPGEQGRRLSEITDDKSHTILLVEARERDVPWSSPHDISFDEAVGLLSDPSACKPAHPYVVRRGFFHKVEPIGEVKLGLHVLMADGSARFLPLPLPRETAIALLTVDGGETIDTTDLDRFTEAQPDYAKMIAVALFVVLAILPAVWCRRSAPPGRSCHLVADAACAYWYVIRMS